MNNIVIISRDWSLYQSRFTRCKALHQHFTLLGASQVPSSEDLAVADVLIAEPDLAALYINNCPKLTWVQSTWAGNNKLQDLTKQDYKLTGVKGVFGSQMLEYVLSYLLYFTRRIEDFEQVKANKKWSQLPCKPLCEYQIGIMGMGNIGQEVAGKLSGFGITIKGLSRSPKLVPGIAMYQYKDLSSFVNNCDFVFNLLPETPATVGLCNQSFFSKMKPGSVFINAGRGSVIDTPLSLVNAIETDHLKAAVLDVFEQEPLPSSHVYYTTKNVYLSCHTAAVSDPNKVFDLFEKNALHYIAGEPLLYEHDFMKGY